MKDLFSTYAGDYAKYRPQYPDELFAFIYSKVDVFDLAWDCGTGNGQSAVELAKKFKQVIATDISLEQLRHAVPTNNIAYAQELSENTSLGDSSVDLITISQALHWFNLPAYYQEVNRVGRPDAIIAAWTYNLLSVDEEVDSQIQNFYFKTLEGYWDKERKYVDSGYIDLYFPYAEMESPGFCIEVQWSLEDLIGYINTWSGVKKFISRNNVNPVVELFNNLKYCWQRQNIKTVKFPLHLKLARISTFKKSLRGK